VYIRNRLGMIEGAETMLAQEHRMNQITNNLANVDTAGYKKEKITFWEMLFETHDNRPRVGKAMKVLIDHSKGSAEMTDSPLDFAIDGEGFFRVQTPNGIRYTRNGNFTLNAEGQITTQEGHLVLGGGGPITLPNENVQVGRDGLITAGGVAIDQLSVVNFTDLAVLEKDGQTLLRLRDESTAEEPVESINIKQGYVEGSNVSTVQEMAEMIDLHRAYQTQQRAIQTIDDLDAQAIGRVGRLTP